MWIIEDWMSHHVYRDKTFKSFEEARDFISEVADEEAKKQSDEAGDYSEEFIEDIYNGICEDLYATEVDEEGNKV